MGKIINFGAKKTPEIDDWETWDMSPHFSDTIYVDGQFAIAIHVNRGENLPNVGDGFLGLDLRKDAPKEELEELLRLLNRHVEWVTYSGHNRPDWPAPRKRFRDAGPNTA